MRARAPDLELATEAGPLAGTETGRSGGRQGADDRRPRPRPHRTARVRAPCEAVEKGRQQVGGKAHAVVAHRDDDLVATGMKGVDSTVTVCTSRHCRRSDDLAKVPLASMTRWADREVGRWPDLEDGCTTISVARCRRGRRGTVELDLPGDERHVEKVATSTRSANWRSSRPFAERA